MKNEQLRRHLDHSIGAKIRNWRQSSKLGNCGNGCYFEKNVEFQRYPKNISLGANVIVKEGTRICACNEQAKISIGDNTTIGFHTFIYSSAEIKIGDNCLIAPFVYIVDSDHEIKKDILINEQPNITQPIEIGNGVWLGTGVKILRGTRIGDGAVIAAGAVVNTDVGPNEIFGGVPAKRIGERS